MQQTPKTAFRILLLAIGLLLFAVVGFKSAQTVSSANPIRGKQQLFMLSQLAQQSPLASPPTAQGRGTYRLADTPPAAAPNASAAPVPAASLPADPGDTAPVSARPVPVARPEPATHAQPSVPAATNPQPAGDANRPGQASAAEPPATLRPLSRLLF